VNRQTFIESLGATCANWRWSWSFVNHAKGWVIFGAWDVREMDKGQVILADDWAIRRERRTPSYKESIGHIALAQSGYALFTFRMNRALAYPGSGLKTSRIKKFEPKIRLMTLERAAPFWLAVEPKADALPEEIRPSDALTFVEGGKKQVLVNSYERSAEARALCLALKGFSCVGCGLDMADRYGDLARNFIHVHHLVRISKLGADYNITPEKDLVPVCPNCHAVIHLREPMLSIEELRETLFDRGVIPEE
jgi:5-methylcytosine-specific restriction enzyme A